MIQPTRDVALFSLAIDVGGTKTLIAILDSEGTIVSETAHKTPIAGVEGLEQSDMERIVELVRSVAFDYAAGIRSSSNVAVQLDVAVVGVPEYVSPDGLVVAEEVLTGAQDATHLFQDAWADCGWVAARTVIDSDVRLGARGELVHGAGIEYPSYAYLSIGTGLSSTFVIGGTIWVGRRGEAIALGEWPVPAACADSAGAQRTTLEHFASGAAISRRYAAVTGEHVSATVVAERAHTGDDSAAHQVVTSAGAAIGRVAGMLVGVLDPDAVVLGGGLGTSTGLFHQALAAEFGCTTEPRPSPPALVIARSGARAGLLGGVTLARSQIDHAGHDPRVS